MSSPHVYKFAIHPEVLSESSSIFTEFNPPVVDCFCFPIDKYWYTEYSFSHLPPLLSYLRSYVYHQLEISGFQIRNSGRMILYSYNSTSDHASFSRSMFYTPGFSRVHAVLMFTKDGVYDSGLIYKKRTPLKHAYLSNLSIEEDVKTDLPEGMGVMYHQDNYMEFVGGTGVLQMMCISFDQK